MESININKEIKMTFSGKNCLITSANTGLGLAVSKKFANMGANTILLCRNKEKGENAVHEIKKEIPNASVELMICDLSSMESIKNLFSSTVDKAAENILYHITSDEAKNKNGKVFKEKQEKPLTEYWKDKGVSERLWSVTESLINNFLS
jgi:NAD(P)-dependent dehydrogenase (short-subunit alcohol dehydrogenase family)